MFQRRNPRVRLLRELPLFAGCRTRELEQIAQITDEVEVPAGSVLTHEGRAGRECFVIVEGKASVSIAGTEVARLGPGELFGEMSLIDRRPRSATVTALTSMLVLVMSTASFNALLAEHPSVADRVLRTITERLRTVQEAMSA